MKGVVYTRQALLQFEDFRYFALNLQNSIRVKAPDYFDRYNVDGKEVFYVRYRKSSHTTWYAFFEELENVYSIIYLGNNQLIGHRLHITL